MKSLVVVTSLALSFALTADQGFLFTARGRIYEVVTRRIGPVLTFPGHWLYEPSVITPSPRTGGSYVLLFSSNLVSQGDINQGEAIFFSESPDGYSHFTAPRPVLTNTGVQDLCDMGDARPIWDGSVWHVYVYAVQGDYHSNECDPTAGVFEATGPTLTSLSWVTYPGGNQARPIVTGQGGAGVAEEMQWFYTLPSGGPATTPFLLTYNDWGAPTTDLLAFQSDGTNNLQMWYQIPTASTGGGTVILPDAILGQSLDAATLGDPAIGIQSACVAGDGRYQYPKGIAFYDDLIPASEEPVPSAPGLYFPGPLESVSNDTNGPRMFRPRLSRNESGYILPLPDVPGLPHTWQGFLYYNDAQVGNIDQCGYYRWFTSDQRFSVSYFEIREQ
jgi:hypothetical protein